MTELTFEQNTTRSPAGDPSRFGRRWRLVGAQLFNVWRFGDLDLALPSGRGLLTGGNGVGKTTGLEALVPYLLDLNAAKLAAGKARPTSLRSLMAETGAKKTIGYATLTFAAPDDEPLPTAPDAPTQQTASSDEGAPTGRPDRVQLEVTYGVRLTYSQTSTPPVRVLPFRVPGRLRDHVRLVGGTEPLAAEAFTSTLAEAGGSVFADEDEYVADLARRLLRTDAEQLRLLADRLRQLRNPSLLADISVDKAAEALRDCLPGVADDVIIATADALAETDETRTAFTRDAEAAAALTEFAATWTGHVVAVTGDALAAVTDAAADVRRAQSAAKAAAAKAQAARTRHTEALAGHASAAGEFTELSAQVKALKTSEEYRSAGRLEDLAATAHAKQGAAAGKLAALEATVSRAHDGHVSAHQSATAVAAQLEELDACVATLAPVGVTLRAAVQVSMRPQPTIAVGERLLDPGARTLVSVDDTAWHDGVGTIRDAASEHESRSVAARAAESRYAQVAAAESAAAAAHDKLARLTIDVETAARTLAARTAEATEARDAVLTALHTWTNAHPQLCGPTSPTGTAAKGTAHDSQVDVELESATEMSWDTDVLVELASATAAEVRDTVTGYQQAATARAATASAEHRSAARRHDEQASEHERQARQLREQAQQFRSGTPRPLPRPSWAGAGQDDRGFATALEWREHVTADVRKALEMGLATSGVLGATVDAAGLRAGSHWVLTAHGPDAARNLTEVLHADPAHPHAATVTALLAQIGLVDSVTGLAVAGLAQVALVIGFDGTFRTGPALADPGAALAAASAGSAVLAALVGHIGAAQRHAAALAAAAALDAEADGIEELAEAAHEQARGARTAAAAVDAAGKAFPRLGSLRTAEEQRAVAAGRYGELDVERDTVDREHGRLATVAAAARDSWTAETRALGLPVTVEELAAVRSIAESAAAELRRLQREAQALVTRLGQAAADAARADQLSEAISTGDALVAHTEAEKAAAELDALRAAVGSDVQRVLDELAQVEPLVEVAAAEQSKWDGRARECEGQLREDTVRAEQAQALAEAQLPALTQARAALRRLLTAPGAAAALLGDASPAPDDAALLAQLQQAVHSRRPTGHRTLRERYDVIRAQLAGQWTLDPGDDVGALMTFQLTFKEEAFTPVSAAATAQSVAEAARLALESGEEHALREFIIGRLPEAIGAAWTDLHDWVREVNAKMRNATASSGVGIQVEVRLRDDLADQERTVYELACRTSTADRTDEQARQVGAALRTLIAVTDADTMTDRVAAAVDIRDWVDLRYVIARPGKSPERWGRKTGLSGGERRLVVLAPMLAAVAAACERFGPQALRICVLDEVPAEVDEAGREGLARYVAELDLDLLCTSYLWDGAPGAWDGIDVHELEAGSDGTVLNWHTKVRGPQPYPHPTLA